MDTSGRIYLPKDDEEAPAGEDRARLDGYLRGRAEADERAAMDAEVERLRELTKTYEDRLSAPAKVVTVTTDATQFDRQDDAAEPVEMRRTRALSHLRQATWEATQFASYDEIREYVSGVLREVETDEP